MNDCVQVDEGHQQFDIAEQINMTLVLKVVFVFSEVISK